MPYEIERTLGKTDLAQEANQLTGRSARNLPSVAAYEKENVHIRLDQRSERDLIERAQAGDVKAFEHLASLHTDHLYAVVLRLMGSRAEAEDVMQESLLRAWRGIGRFQKRAMFFTWLYRIAVNEANRALARRTPRGPGSDIDLDSVQLRAPANQEPAHQAEHHELHAALGRAIAGLEPPHRTALVLRDVEGLSTREAADIVGVSEAAFKSRLHQARLRVRAAIGDERLAAAVP